MHSLLAWVVSKKQLHPTFGNESANQNLFFPGCIFNFMRTVG
jgi:hypothetical protein